MPKLGHDSFQSHRFHFILVSASSTSDAWRNVCQLFVESLLLPKANFNHNQKVSTFNPTKKQQNSFWFESNVNLIILLQYIAENV
jgi:hypothetical protein